MVSELDKLPVELQNKAVQYGIRRAARITQAAAKTEAPVRESGFLGPKRAGRKKVKGRREKITVGRLPGYLRSSIKVKRKKERNRDRITMVVGPSKWGFYGRFLELGTRHIAAREWLGPALEKTASDVIETMKQEIRAGIEKIVRTAARRRG